jgi:hypothetical protein
MTEIPVDLADFLSRLDEFIEREIKPLEEEHIYRHHRRYRITEGSEEMQIRNVAGHLFGFIRR